MGAELFHAGGRTDMTELIFVSRIPANAPKNGRDSIIGLATKPRTAISGVRNPTAAKNFFLLQNVQMGFGPYPASHQWVPQLYYRCKSVEAWSWPLTSSYSRGWSESPFILLVLYILFTFTIQGVSKWLERFGSWLYPQVWWTELYVLVFLQVYNRCLQMFEVGTLGRTAQTEAIVQFLPHSDQHVRCYGPALFPLQRHPVVCNCWYQRLMLLEDGGSLLNCRRNASWTETTDSCFTNCCTQNAFCSGVAIIAVLRHRPEREQGWGGIAHEQKTLSPAVSFHVGKLNFCMRFQGRDGGLKPLQLCWYTLYLVFYTKWEKINY